MAFKLFMWVAGAATVAAACSGSSSGGASSSTASGAQTSASQSSASSSTGAGGMAPTCSGEADAALQCKAPKVCGDPVTMMNVPQTLPPGAGGKVADGVYVLSAYNLYTGKGGQGGASNFKIDEVLVVEGGGKTLRWELGTPDPKDQTKLVHNGFSGTLDTSKGFFTATTQCPGTVTGKDLAYTATANKLTLYDTANQDERILDRRGP